MCSVKTELAKVSPWFIHASIVENFPSIKATGLLPSNPWASEGRLNQIGDASNNFVCLKAISSKQDTTPTRHGLYFFLAIRVEHLSENLVPDLSYYKVDPDSDRSGKTAEKYLVDVAHRLGSIGSLESLPVGFLRVRCKICDPNEPINWPQLQDIGENDLFLEDRRSKI